MYHQPDVSLSVRQHGQSLFWDKTDFLLGPFASNFVIADPAPRQMNDAASKRLCRL